MKKLIIPPKIDENKTKNLTDEKTTNSAGSVQLRNLNDHKSFKDHKLENSLKNEKFKLNLTVSTKLRHSLENENRYRLRKKT